MTCLSRSKAERSGLAMEQKEERSAEERRLADETEPLEVDAVLSPQTSVRRAGFNKGYLEFIKGMNPSPKTLGDFVHISPRDRSILHWNRSVRTVIQRILRKAGVELPPYKRPSDF